MSSLMPTYGRLPVAFARGDGAVLYDTAGRAFLDGVSGIAVTNLGHCHPAITEACIEQAQTLVHTSNLYHIQAQEQLADQLVVATDFERAFFCNSGAEANETAIKLARLYGHRRGIQNPQIIVLEGAFHGRTMGALSATGNQKIQEGFGPLLSGFIRVPRDDVAALEQATENTDVVAMLIEPVQGEGGVHAISDEFLRSARMLSDRQQCLLMFDEVQTGNGRCGALYAYQRLGVVPDVLVTAKGLGNGFPIGACLARGDAASVLGPGDHGTTYGGNPLCCAAANAVISTLLDDELYARAEPIRAALLSAFQAELDDPARVLDIRGLGLMIGIAPACRTDELVRRGLEAGVLLNIAGGNTIRLLPPLVMTEVQAAELGHAVATLINTTPLD
jgi:acetylornithine/N-succinyldiaminopimelate aminotransferase